MVKRKVLYVMGIDWNWIYQRPQIIEQHLEQGNDVTVIFPRSILKAFAQRQTAYPKYYRILWTLPLQEKIKIISWISHLLNRHLFGNIQSYDVIVIGFPLYYRYVPQDYAGTLIYDCMDNYEALYGYRKGVPKLLELERKLVVNSSLVFTTSQRLQEKMQKYVTDSVPQIVLLRNGTKIPECLPGIAKPMLQARYKIGYIGTISKWFDKDLILKSLREVDDVEYHLIGPSNIEFPDNVSRLTLEGTVQHDLLYDIAASYSCLIMPFRIDDTVLYVDPVKLYEYIAMGKCIISIFYPELDRFREFVYFYYNDEDYIELLVDLKSKGFPPKYTSQQRKAFLEKNSWEARFALWDEIVKDIAAANMSLTYREKKNEYQSDERVWDET